MNTTRSPAPSQRLPSTATKGAAPASSLPGKVFLVGAGPGDPELLTLKAVRAIVRADVILLDDLVNPEILSHARADVRIVHVGKRAGRCASTPQAFIEKLMLSEALAGRCVLRLKGGDPLIFGRAGEELQALRAAGVSVEIINGVTAGLAACGSLGVSLTHRDHARGVLWITGHVKTDSPQSAAALQKDIDWRSIGQSAQAAQLSLVIYMGLANSAHIQKELLLSLPAQTPAAIVQNASLPQQKQVLTTLGDLHNSILREGMASPCIIVIGEVLQSAVTTVIDANCFKMFLSGV